MYIHGKSQDKKLATNSLQFTYQNLKSCKPHEKIKQKHQNNRCIDEKLKTKSLMLFVSFFFSYDLQDFKLNMGTAKHLTQASCTELTNMYYTQASLTTPIISIRFRDFDVT